MAWRKWLERGRDDCPALPSTSAGRLCPSQWWRPRGETPAHLAPEKKEKKVPFNSKFKIIEMPKKSEDFKHMQTTLQKDK
jgi:hypothetical protein